MFTNDAVGKLLTLRIRELCNKESEWYRRLWNFGTIGQLRELLSLGDPRASASARDYALNAAMSLVTKDPALTGPRRGAVIRALPKKKDLERFTSGSYSFNLLLHEVDLLQADYLKLWIRHIPKVSSAANGNSTLDINLYAQLITAHLHTVGFSVEWILNFCNYELNRKSEESAFVEMLERADTVSTKGNGEWTFLIPVSKRTRIDSKTGRPWLTRKDFTARFQESFPQAEVPRHVGGLELQVIALDKYSAFKAVRRRISQAESRVRAGSKRRTLTLSDNAWVNPGAFKADLSRNQSLTISIPALDVEGGKHTFQKFHNQIESALDLLAGFDNGIERSSCINAWAAVESLLADREDFGQIATVSSRAADILTCRLLVGELLALATTHIRAGKDALSETLRNLPPKERVTAIEQHLRTGQTLTVGEGVGKIRLIHLQSIISSTKSIREAHEGIEAAFRRLYRARNSIIHAGETEPYGFSQIMTSSAILLGALLDAVIESHRSTGEPASLTAVKAHWAIEEAIESGAFEPFSMMM